METETKKKLGWSLIVLLCIGILSSVFFRVLIPGYVKIIMVAVYMLSAWLIVYLLQDPSE